VPCTGTLRAPHGLRDMVEFRSLLIAMVLALAGAGFAPALADPFKPIVIINTYPPNGPADIVGRTAISKMLKLMTTFAAPALTDVIVVRAGDAMGHALDRIVTVDRRSHARSIPGVRFVVTARPDGDTLLFSNSLDLITLPRLHRLPYEPRRDLTPVAAIARMPVVMIALAKGGPASVRAFVEAAQAAPGTLNYASSGDFRSGHLAGELFVKRTGVSVVHVSYNGGNEALSGVIKGHVPVAFVPLPSVLPAIPGGKIRILGIADRMRHETLPHVPTISESGVPGFEAASWFGIYTPAGTPEGIVARLNQGMVSGLRSAQLERQLLSQGLQARYPSAAAFRDLMRAEQQKWAPVMDGLSPPY
jgi:tripartite-type tricarboxylate transporter receptor subunit TctC